MTYLQTASDAVRAALHDHAYPTGTSEVYDLLGELDQLTRSVQALTERVSARLDVMATDPALRVDGLGKPVEPAHLAHDAAEALALAAATWGEAAPELGHAWSAAGRLYLDDITHGRSGDR